MLTLILMIGSALGTAAIFLSLYIIYKRIVKKRNASGNELSGIIFSAISLIYSLIIAFVIIAVWDDYEELKQTIAQEADGLTEVSVNSTLLPSPLKEKIQKEVSVYCRNAIQQEWINKPVKIMPSNLRSLRLYLMTQEGLNAGQQKVLDETVNNLNELTDLRRARLSHVRSHIPGLVWIVLLIASTLFIAFSFFFEHPSERFKQLCIALLSGTIGMCMFLIYMLDHPFTGSSQVSDAPYIAVLETLDTL